MNGAYAFFFRPSFRGIMDLWSKRCLASLEPPTRLVKGRIRPHIFGSVPKVEGKSTLNNMSDSTNLKHKDWESLSDEQKDMLREGMRNWRSWGSWFSWGSCMYLYLSSSSFAAASGVETVFVIRNRLTIIHAMMA
jgi:hypothetical protein